MTWEDKIKMAKEADPSLSDEAAARVVRDLEGFAELALEEYLRQKRGNATPKIQQSSPKP